MVVGWPRLARADTIAIRGCVMRNPAAFKRAQATFSGEWALAAVDLASAMGELGWEVAIIVP